jgi:hypothetical protein
MFKDQIITMDGLYLNPYNAKNYNGTVLHIENMKARGKG